jgi:hypothetical protein
MGQQQAHALQQMAASLDHFVGAVEYNRPHFYRSI